MHYGDFVRRHARRNPAGAAIVDCDGTVTYSELDARTNRLAKAFSLLGGERGDRVAFLGDNGRVPCEIMIAATKAGLIYVPVDFRLSEPEIVAILENCQPAICIVGSTHVILADRVRRLASYVKAWIGAAGKPGDGWTAYEELIASGSSVSFDYAPDDGVFCIIFTSGTTGQAKGVQISHADTMQNGMALASAYGVDAGTRFLMSLPYSATGVVNHSSGPTLMMGGTVVFDDVRRFDAERYFSTVARHRVTHSQLVPTMMYRLLDSPVREDFDLSSLGVVGYGSAAIPPVRVRQMLEAFGPIFVQAYGMTECCSLATVLTREDHRVVGTYREAILASCGRAVPQVEIRVADDRDMEVGRGEIGEILIRAPWNTAGYWRDDTRTRELVRNGWLHTGDLGYLDEQDYLFIVDRKKDMINTGGSKVYSSEVEAAIISHPNVVEVAVIGVPDDEWGERVHAVIVTKGGMTPTLEEIRSHASEKISRYKLPKTMQIAINIPKTSTGKYAKEILRKTVLDR